VLSCDTRNTELELLTDAEIGIDPISGRRRDKEISLLSLAIVLVRHRKRILAVTLGCAGLGLIVALLVPNRYTARTSILPPQQNSSTTGTAIMAQMAQLGSLGSSLAGNGPLGLKNPNDLQVAMLRSRTVEDAMIDRFHLMQLYHVKYRAYARKKLEKYVDIDDGAKDGVIRISVTDTDPRRAADLANGYVDEFKKFSSTLAVTEASRRRMFFEQQLVEAKDDLANAEEALSKTENQTGVIEVESQTRAAIESVAQLRAQIAAKEVQIRGLHAYATDHNPEMVQAEDELAGLQAEQAQMASDPDNPSNSLLIPTSRTQQASLEYVRRLRDVRYYQAVFDLLARQYEAAKVDEAREGPGVQVVDRAVPPELRSSPKILLMVAGALVLGLFLSVCWSFAIEAMHRVATNPDEQAHLETLHNLLSSGKRKRFSVQ
jgi:tyrosine-protein kinase Etk/Wzc